MDTTNATGRSVVVGVDGSEGSRTALKWAMNKQERFGKVRTVTAFRVGPFDYGLAAFQSAEAIEEAHRGSAEKRLREFLKDDYPNLMETATVVQSHPGEALVQAGAGADLLVVGNRGRSAIAEALIGSVGSHCVKHSKVPVAVVTPEATDSTSLEFIAVGVDGSANSMTALRWAFDHADPNGKVLAVGVYNPVAFAIDGYVPPIELLEKQTRSAVQDVVDEVMKNAEAGPEVEIEVRAGDPRTQLRAAGEEADLLVLGARGHRGVGYLLLGSVTTSILHHPTSTTVVVPH